MAERLNGPEDSWASNLSGQIRLKSSPLLSFEPRKSWLVHIAHSHVRMG